MEKGNRRKRRVIELKLGIYALTQSFSQARCQSRSCPLISHHPYVPVCAGLISRPCYCPICRGIAQHKICTHLLHGCEYLSVLMLSAGHVSLQSFRQCLCLSNSLSDLSVCTHNSTITRTCLRVCMSHPSCPSHHTYCPSHHTPCPSRHTPPARANTSPKRAIY